VINQQTQAGEVRVIQERCRSWACDDCRKSRGHLVRNRMLAKAPEFSKPVLFTFTVDRTSFESPEAAYDYVREHKFLPRLMRRLGLPKWVSVLEFQEQSGEGWPHWHFLVDSSSCPSVWRNGNSGAVLDRQQYAALPKSEKGKGWGFIPHYIDFGKAIEIVKGWGISRHLRFSTSAEQRAASTAAHAIRYICKYLIKGSRRGVPPWVLQRSRVRFLAASRPIGRLVSPDPDETPKEAVEDDSEPETREESGPMVRRVSECGLRWVAIGLDERHVVDRRKGFATSEMLGKCPWLVTWEDFAFTDRGPVPYTVRGFQDWDGYWQWSDLCDNSALQAAVCERIAVKENWLLTRWERAA
jgi:hypothetical protein